MPFEEQTASIFAGTNGYLDNIPVTDVTRYEAALLSYMRSEHAGLLSAIRDAKDLTDDAKKGLVAALDAFGTSVACCPRPRASGDHAPEPCQGDDIEDISRLQDCRGRDEVKDVCLDSSNSRPGSGRGNTPTRL